MTIRETEAAWRLLTASAVRERAELLLARGLAGELRCFTVHPERLDAIADYVLARTPVSSVTLKSHAAMRSTTVTSQPATRDDWEPAMSKILREVSDMI